MKKLLLSLFLCLGLALHVNAADDLVDYSNNIKADGKGVLLILGSSSCPYCEVLMKDINTNKELRPLVEEAMNVYYIPVDQQVPVKMGDKSPQMETNSVSLKMQFGSRVTPTIVMFDKEWKKIIQLPGYADPNQMKIFVTYVKEELYKTTPLGDYLKEKGLI